MLLLLLLLFVMNSISSGFRKICILSMNKKWISMNMHSRMFEDNILRYNAVCTNYFQVLTTNGLFSHPCSLQKKLKNIFGLENLICNFWILDGDTMRRIETGGMLNGNESTWHRLQKIEMKWREKRTEVKLFNMQNWFEFPDTMVTEHKQCSEKIQIYFSSKVMRALIYINSFFSSSQ